MFLDGFRRVLMDNPDKVPPQYVFPRPQLAAISQLNGGPP
jgi:hypothetical protein